MKTLTKKAIALMISVFCLFAVPLTVSAGPITSLNAESADGKITVSGKAGAGVLAVAVMVYDSSDNLVVMETNAVDNGSYKFTFSYTFADGDYTVKAADYAGGDFVTTKVTVKSASATSDSSADSSAKRVKDSVPKTGEEPKSPIWPLAGVTLLASGVILIKIMKKEEM